MPSEYSRQNCTDFSYVQGTETISACMIGFSGSAISSVLSAFFREQRVLPCQRNLGKISQNCSKLGHNFGPRQTTFRICV